MADTIIIDPLVQARTLLAESLKMMAEQAAEMEQRHNNDFEEIFNDQIVEM